MHEHDPHLSEAHSVSNELPGTSWGDANRLTHHVSHDVSHGGQGPDRSALIAALITAAGAIIAALITTAPNVVKLL